jgi:pimeloyl-ACP methyl ester carboxylesterase
MPVSDPLLNAARANAHEAIDMANTWSHSSFAHQGGNENPGVTLTLSGQRLLERAGPGVYFADLNACNDFIGGETLATQIKAETLVILGLEDRMARASAGRSVAAAISDVRVVELDACGHSMLSEQPNAVLDALAALV